MGFRREILADMGLSPKVVAWLRGAGHDAVHLREEGLQRLPDDAVFAEGPSRRSNRPNSSTCRIGDRRSVASCITENGIA